MRERELKHHRLHLPGLVQRSLPMRERELKLGVLKHLAAEQVVAPHAGA